MPVQPATTEASGATTNAPLRAIPGKSSSRPTTRNVTGRPLMVEFEDVAVGEAGLPAGSAVETMAGIGSSVRARGRGRRRTDEQARDAEGHRRTGDDLVVRLRVDRLEGHARPVARGGRQRRVADDDAGRHRTGARDRTRIECRIERGAGRGLDPVIGPDVRPRDLDLAAFDADLEDRREGPDRHGQGQDQERQVAGGWMPAE